MADPQYLSLRSRLLNRWHGRARPISNRVHREQVGALRKMTLLELGLVCTRYEDRRCKILTPDDLQLIAVPCSGELIGLFCLSCLVDTGLSRWADQQVAPRQIDKTAMIVALMHGPTTYRKPAHRKQTCSDTSGARPRKDQTDYIRGHFDTFRNGVRGTRVYEREDLTFPLGRIPREYADSEGPGGADQGNTVHDVAFACRSCEFRAPTTAAIDDHCRESHGRPTRFPLFLGERLCTSSHVVDPRKALSSRDPQPIHQNARAIIGRRADPALF